MQVGTYPTKNFATFRPSWLQPPFTIGYNKLEKKSPINLKALGRSQTLYIVKNLAKSCVFIKQSPFPFLCHLINYLNLQDPPSP